MGAPSNAVSIIPVGEECTYDGKLLSYDDALKELPGVICDCGWRGSIAELLEDPDDPLPASTMWCPQCNTTGWVYE